jgi:hypothetical protein
MPKFAYSRIALGLFRPLFLAAALAGTQGCLVMSSNSSGIEAETPDEKLAFREINKAAAKPKAERAAALAAIAGQIDLSETPQAYLVHKIFRSIRDDEVRLSLIDILLKNPSFSLAAAIRLEYEERHLHSDAARSQIETRLDQHRPPSE